ncbi:MAG: hypothetical protein SCALA702_14730 [Melioribacteraceae bacterium]|nr:MAG: hypothetical protein SCALA702_14730 [Melioribacteraceae bacterium]
MSEKYIIQKNPVKIPVPGNKIINEYFGFASLNGGDFSFAHMIAPPGWEEPAQKPEFDEITFIIKGKKRFEFDDEIVELKQGESILVKRGTRVRYSNPFEEACEYISVCIPAFSPDSVNRENNI